MKEQKRVSVSSVMIFLSALVWLLLAISPRGEASSAQIPKGELKELAAMIAAGESLDKINGAWAVLVAKYRDADFSKAIDNIIRQAKSGAEKLVKDARARVKGFEPAQKQIRSEIDRVRKISQQMKQGKEGLRVQQKSVEKLAGKIKLTMTSVQLTTPEAAESYIEELEKTLSSVGDDAQLANIDLQNKLQQQQQTLQTISNVSKMIHATALSILRKIG